MYVLLQKVEQLREEVRVKFDNQNVLSDGIKVAFRLPDGTKMQHVFSNSSTIKVSV